MDVLKGKWKEKSICNVCTLLLLCWSIGPSLSAPPHFNRTRECQEGSQYLSKDGFCCGNCHPEFRLVSDCTKDNENARCERCKSGTYRGSSNSFKNCDRCKKCSENEVTLKYCTTRSNTECQCKEGFYRKRIDDLTWECHTCLTCGEGEELKLKCERDRNSVCECKESYYRDTTKKCLPCQNCSSDDCWCRKAYTTPKTDISSNPNDPRNTQWIPIVLGMGFCLVVLLVVLAIMTSFFMKQWVSRSPSAEKKPLDDMKFTQRLIQGDSENVFNQTVPFMSPVCDDPEHLSKLPDCVPKEIKISEFIYAVLEHVPPRRVKELVRSLDVSDRVIELAENDYLRDTKEAQYQMLKVWANGGAQGRGGVLPRPLLFDMLAKLRNMDLGGAAEELETKYGEH